MADLEESRIVQVNAPDIVFDFVHAYEIVIFENDQS